MLSKSKMLFVSTRRFILSNKSTSLALILSFLLTFLTGLGAYHILWASGESTENLTVNIRSECQKPLATFVKFAQIKDRYVRVQIELEDFLNNSCKFIALDLPKKTKLTKDLNPYLSIQVKTNEPIQGKRSSGFTMLDNLDFSDPTIGITNLVDSEKWIEFAKHRTRFGFGADQISNLNETLLLWHTDNALKNINDVRTDIDFNDYKSSRIGVNFDVPIKINAPKWHTRIIRGNVNNNNQAPRSYSKGPVHFDSYVFLPDATAPLEYTKTEQVVYFEQRELGDQLIYRVDGSLLIGERHLSAKFGYGYVYVRRLENEQFLLFLISACFGIGLSAFLELLIAFGRRSKEALPPKISDEYANNE